MIILDVMVLNDIINEAATGPPFSGDDQSSPPTVSAVVGNSRSTQIRPSITSLSKGEKHRRNARRKISMMYGDEEEGPRLKERMTEACYQGIDIFCVWDCCWAYIKFSEVFQNHLKSIN